MQPYLKIAIEQYFPRQTGSARQGELLSKDAEKLVHSGKQDTRKHYYRAADVSAAPQSIHKHSGKKHQ